MKKKIVSTMLCATMIATMLAGCGGSDNGGSDNGGSAATDNGGSTEEAAPAGDSADSGETAAPAAGGGSVYWLNFKPESDEVLQEVAADYTAKTGVEVKVVTAASGTYSTTLLSEMDKSAPPTLFIIGNQAGVKDWKDYALDLNGDCKRAEYRRL